MVVNEKRKYVYVTITEQDLIDFDFEQWPFSGLHEVILREFNCTGFGYSKSFHDKAYKRKVTAGKYRLSINPRGQL